MDFYSKKILKYINKFSDTIDIDKVLEYSKIPEDDFFEIMGNLLKEDYIKFPQNGYVETTNKGKTYFSVVRRNWISKNIVAVFALIVSIIALIRTF